MWLIFTVNTRSKPKVGTNSSFLVLHPPLGVDIVNTVGSHLKFLFLVSQSSERPARNKPLYTSSNSCSYSTSPSWPFIVLREKIERWNSDLLGKANWHFHRARVPDSSVGKMKGVNRMVLAVEVTELGFLTFRRFLCIVLDCWTVRAQNIVHSMFITKNLWLKN